MDANALVDAIVAELLAENTYVAMQHLLVLRANPVGLDDAHKILLADAMLNPVWVTKPPRAPADPQDA